ncbi:hypothetical protein SDC9_37023 [bioreactor metagenome]|uniref:Uncharacterized protein n=1 Tax=bioreactor metagenome TaxID=1076179 RepID=A0A644VHU3_9ZZZZ
MQKGARMGRPSRAGSGCGSAERGVAALAGVGMRMGADVGQDLPAALAFLALGGLEDHRDARNLGQAEGLVRRRIGGHGQRRGDAQVIEADRAQRRGEGFVLDMHDRRGLERGADHLGGTLHLERGGDRTAGAADALPFLRERLVLPVGGRRREVLQMNRAILGREAAEPDVLHGEGQDRRKPGAEPEEQQVHHRAHRAPAQAVGRVAVKRILAHVEPERREVDGAEVEQHLEHAREVEGPVVGVHLGIKLGQPVQHPAFELGHLGNRHALGLVKARERAQHEAQRVAQTAIAVRGALQDLRPDALVGGIVGLRHPQPQDVGAVFVDHLLRRDGVADRLGHLHALLVEREAMRHHVAIGRAADRGRALQQRGVEPAAVLVGAFHVDVGDAVPGAVRTVAQHEGMRRPAIEPDIEHVIDLFIIRRIDDAREQLFLETLHIPDIGAVHLESGGDPGVDLGIAQQEVGVGRLRALLGEAGERHAPGALARQHPVRPVLDHRMQAVAAGGRGELHQLLDRAQGAGADGVAIGAHAVVEFVVDRGKPLRRVAIDHRRLRAPGMRVGVLDLALRQQRARPGELLDVRHVRRAFLAVLVQDRLAAEDRQVGAIGAVGLDIVGHRQLELHAKLIVVVAVRGRGVDKAGAGVLGDVIAGQHRHVIIPLALRLFEPGIGMLQHHALELGGRDVAQPGEARHLRRGHHGFGQRIGQHQQLARDGGRFLVRRIDAIHPVSDARVVGDRAVLRDRPGSGGPDHHRRPVKPRDRAEPHPDRVRGVVVILDLGLGERRLLDRRPHHRLRALIERAVHQEFHEFLGDHRLGMEIHRQIGIGPVPGHAEPLEFLALHGDPVLGELATFLAEGDGVDVVLVQPLGAILLLDLPFDRQAVAVPARDIAAVVAHHLMAAHDDVLDRLVQRVADVQMAVGIGRAVMQHERGAGIVAALFAQLVIDRQAFPAGQPFGLARGQAGAHLELGFGQEDGVAIVDGVFGRVSAHRKNILGLKEEGRAARARGLQQSRPP